MARYEVLEPSFLGTRIYQPGEIFEFDGIPGPNLKPLDKPAEAKAAEAAASDAESLARQKAAAETGDPDNAKKARKAA